MGAERSASPRVALALALLAAVSVFLVSESSQNEGNQAFIQSDDVVMQPHTVSMPAAAKPADPGAVEKAMVQCNSCRQKLEAACESNGSYPKCKKAPAVQRQFGACVKKGMKLNGDTLVCPGDLKVLPAKVKCNQCRDRLEEACEAVGGYPTCQHHKAVQAITQRCERHTGLANIKGVLVCPGDAKIDESITCEACRVGVVTKCDEVGGFPKCLNNAEVHQAYVKCSRGGLKRLPETKALSCPGEEGHPVDDETAVCDACRDKLQGECGKLGGYPTCMKSPVVKATLQDCQQRRNLKLLQGRLYCKGDTLIKPAQRAAPKVEKRPFKPLSKKKMMKKIAAAQKVVRSHSVKLGAPVHSAKRSARPPKKKKKKSKPRMPTKVIKPPAGLTCEACRDHLTATCTKLGGKAGGMKPCEHDPRYKKIFNKIFSSCNKYRGLVLHKNGSLGCPSDNKPHHTNKARKLLPVMPPAPAPHTTNKVKQNKPKAIHKPKRAKKTAAPKKVMKKAAAKKPTKKKAVAKKPTEKKVAAKKKAKNAAAKKEAPKKVVSKVEVAKLNKAKAASAQTAAKMAHGVVTEHKKVAKANIVKQDKARAASAQTAAARAHGVIKSRQQKLKAATVKVSKAKEASAQKAAALALRIKGHE